MADQTDHPARMRTDSYDYVIVGAGSAGCALACRLGADPGLRILVIEAGGNDRSPLIRLPLAWGQILKHRRFDWGYDTEPEPGLAGRQIECSRGKVVGGCSAINGMAYARGLPADYDGWAHDLGLSGWSFDDCLPYFKRSEAWQYGETSLRGGDGPLTVIQMRYPDPLVEGFLTAAAACGYRQTEDYNGADQDGFGPMQATIRGGRRCSAAVAYLRPALARGNVTLMTHSLAQRIVLRSDDGSVRAVGVVYRRRGQDRLASARREVILCGGVINTPQLLMLSGVGPADELRGHGLAVAVDLPGVGANLHDHLVFDLRWRRREPGPLHRMLRLDRLGLDLLRTLVTGKGLSGQIPAAAVGLIRSDRNLALPDVQLILAAGPMTATPWLPPLRRAYDDAFGLKGVYLTPQSRGRVRLNSADPARMPRIEQNFLATAGDRQAVRQMFDRMREIGAQPALDRFIANELAPGVAVNDDAAINAFIRDTAITLHHPVGTCRMGRADDAMAVLDDKLRVRGVAALRVVDGSAMPRIVRAPTHAPIVMMAEKIADHLLGRPPPKGSLP